MIHSLFSIDDYHCVQFYPVLAFKCLIDIKGLMGLNCA